jgi:putative two-component system response regulator
MLGGRAAVALALGLFLGISALRVSDANAGNAEGTLYALPIAVLALRFGLRGGMMGALMALGLVAAWDHQAHDLLTARGYVDHGVSFLALGALLGGFVDHRRRLEAEIVRHFDASLDLLMTADMTGRFLRVNPAWERTLGHSAEAMCSRPLFELVHPDDCQATIAEVASVADGSRDIIGFRNRCRTADGSYLWLEWSARACPSEGVIHGVARDVTAQRSAELGVANDAKRLEMRVAERARDLNEARAETLQLLAVAGEYRDDETSQHTERVGVIAARIAARLGLSSESVGLLREAAPLHDIGKLAIQDRILLKPCKLSAQEQAIMQTHATLGARLLFGSRSPALQLAGVIAESHHERWDGTGYPKGLAGEAIPLVGRIVAVADVFDALTHDRPYKSAWTAQRASGEIQRAAGSQFDPRVVVAFLTMYNTPPPPTTNGARRERRRSPAVQPAPLMETRRA